MLRRKKKGFLKSLYLRDWGPQRPGGGGEEKQFTGRYPLAAGLEKKKTSNQFILFHGGRKCHHERNIGGIRTRREDKKGGL